MAEVDRKIPEVGMRFRTPDEGWLFWVEYGGRTGFDVRKRGSNVSKMDGKVTSCRYVCSNEGVRTKKQTEDVRKCFRAETRTDCKARMVIILDRGVGNYEVTDVVLQHNHLLHTPETFHLMRSQRRISELQAFEIETADDSGIRPKAAHELATRQVGGPLNLSYTCRDRKNYLQSKRQRELAFGQAGSMLKYFHDKIVENPSFQYALQLDCEEHITNIFWADAKMVLDYAHFGDVVTFDTTFGTNKEYHLVFFEAFQGEYERCMAACARVLDGEHKYAVAVGNLLGELSSEVEYIVIGDLINQNATCSCRLFERTGILCAHGLKVLDLMNIKRLPPHYILKRWTREARTGNIQDRQGRKVVANPKLEAQLRYKYMSHKFHNLAHKVAISPECCVLLENALDCLSVELEDKLNLLSSSGTNEPCEDKENVDQNVQQMEDFSAAQLKKKEVQSNKSKRPKTWLDKLCKGKRKIPIAKPTKKGVKQQKKNDGSQPLEVKDDGSHKEINEAVEQYNIISNFTQLVAVPTYDDDILEDQDLF